MKTKEKLLRAERLETIKNFLVKNKTVKVNDLSLKLSVSENTIRRDLLFLEAMGRCKRVSGGATLDIEGTKKNPLIVRRDFQKKDKNMIALKASKLIKNGMTVIIDSGTTAIELANEIKERSHITVITPSLDVANILASKPEITLILPGGIIHPYSRSLTGEPAAAFFKEVHADILFLAVKGLSLHDGLTDHTITEAFVKKQMLKSADKIAVLADHSKFGKKALYPICKLNEADLIITDDEGIASLEDKLSSMGIKVL